MWAAYINGQLRRDYVEAHKSDEEHDTLACDMLTKTTFISFALQTRSAVQLRCIPA